MANQKVEVGDKAPDFTLRDQNRNEVKLSDYRGKKVVLSWHPLAWTSTCTLQMKDLEAHRQDYEERGAVALGISVDTAPSKKAWAEDMGIENTLLLADFWPHGDVAQKYGVFDEKSGASKRAVFIIDEEGIVRWKKIYPGGERPDVDEILRAVSEI
jgi:peroxiredoxin